MFTNCTCHVSSRRHPGPQTPLCYTPWRTLSTTRAAQHSFKVVAFVGNSPAENDMTYPTCLLSCPQTTDWFLSGSATAFCLWFVSELTTVVVAHVPLSITRQYSHMPPVSVFLFPRIFTLTSLDDSKMRRFADASESVSSTNAGNLLWLCERSSLARILLEWHWRAHSLVLPM